MKIRALIFLTNNHGSKIDGMKLHCILRFALSSYGSYFCTWVQIDEFHYCLHITNSKVILPKKELNCMYYWCLDKCYCTLCPSIERRYNLYAWFYTCCAQLTVVKWMWLGWCSLLLDTLLKNHLLHRCCNIENFCCLKVVMCLTSNFIFFEFIRFWPLSLPLSIWLAFCLTSF